MWKKPVKTANEILKKLWELSFPLNVNNVIDFFKKDSWAEIELYEYAFLETKDDISWMSKKDEGKYHIVLNPDQSDAKYRFTAMHELWHIVLGHLEWSGVLVNYAFRRDWRYSPDDMQKEREADMFASNILMPERAVRNKLSIKIDLKEVSNYFWVTQKAMYNRASILWLVNQLT